MEQSPPLQPIPRRSAGLLAARGLRPLRAAPARSLGVCQPSRGSRLRPPAGGLAAQGGLLPLRPPRPRCGRLAVGGDPPPPFLRHCGRLRRPRARSPPAASARASPSLPAPVVSVGAAARWVLPRWAPRAGVCLCAAARPSPLRGGWLAAGWGRGGAPPPSARGPLRGSCRSGGVFRALRRAGCRLKPCAARAAFARDADGWQKIKMHQSENWCK